MKTPILETECLILRPVTLDDAPAIQKYFNNWDIVQHLATVIPWPYPDDGAESFVRDQCLPAMEKGESFVWVITLKSGDGEAIGVIDFHGRQRTGGGDRGFWIGVPFQGKGYMTEAIAATNDFLFFEAGIERFVVFNAKVNVRSRRVKEKTGAKFLEIVRLNHHSGTSETEKWEVTRENWEKFCQKDH